MLKVMIIDDELMARKSLEHLCEKVGSIEIVGLCESAEEALVLLDTVEVDLLFLDIEMPQLSGIEMIEKLSYLPLIIFTTSNKQYAYEAYEYDVTDFLKKPINLPRFIKSLEKAEARIKALNEITKGSEATEIYVKVDGRLVRIPFTSIHYFENVGDYVSIVSDLGNHIIHATMKGIDAKLNNPRLIKIHRSYIINLDRVVDIEDNTVVIGKKVIPISRAHKTILLQRLNIL